MNIFNELYLLSKISIHYMLSILLFSHLVLLLISNTYMLPPKIQLLLNFNKKIGLAISLYYDNNLIFNI